MGRSLSFKFFLAAKLWLKGFALLTLVVNNMKFKDRVQVLDESDRNAV